MVLQGEIRSIPLDHALLSIRQRVLWPDKALSSLQIDGDESALHFGYFVEENVLNNSLLENNILKNNRLNSKTLNSNLVSVASVYITQDTAQLRKFATLTHYQHQGIGSALLSHILKEISTKKVSYFWCDARESASLFYEKFGMKKEGGIFYKSTVSYYRMSKIIKR